MPNNNEKELNGIRTGTVESKFVSSYSARALKARNLKSNINNRVNVWDIDARYQQEWNWRDDSNWRRKFVDQLYVWWDSDHNWYQLYIRIKDERWASINWFQSDWRPTEDHRIISYNVSWSATFLGGVLASPYTGPQEFVGSQSQYLDRYSDYQILLATDRWAQGSDDSWSVEVSGNIYQWLPNDYSWYAFDKTGYPLW